MTENLVDNCGIPLSDERVYTLLSAPGVFASPFRQSEDWCCMYSCGIGPVYLDESSARNLRMIDAPEKLINELNDTSRWLTSRVKKAQRREFNRTHWAKTPELGEDHYFCSERGMSTKNQRSVSLRPVSESYRVPKSVILKISRRIA